MGWASGSELAEDVWRTVRKFVPDKDKKKVARKVVDLFTNYDCDTIEEATTLIKDAEIDFDGEF